MVDYNVASEVADILKEDGRPLCFQQARLSQRVLDLGALPEDGYVAPMPPEAPRPIKVKNKPGEVFSFSVKHGGIGNLGTATPGGTRASPSSVKYQKARAQPKIIANTVEFPDDMLHVAQGGNGIDDIVEKVQTAGSQYGAYMSRSFGGAQVASPSSGGALAATTFVVTDSSGYFVGQTYDVYNSGGTFVQSFRVFDVQMTMSETSITITLYAALPTALATTDTIYLKGEGAAATRFVSMSDICASGTFLYGIVDGTFPSGLSHDMSGASWDNILGRKVCDVIAAASNSRPNFLLSSSIGVSKIVNAGINLRRFAEGDVQDVYALRPKFNELDLVADDNQPSSKIRFVNSESVSLHQSWAYAPGIDGMQGGSWDKGSLMKAHDRHSHYLFLDGGCEFICTHRRANAEMINVAAS